MRTLLFAGILLLAVGVILAAPAASGVDRLPPRGLVPSTVEQLAVVNYGTDVPALVTTHIENAAGDKLDFNGEHFFGRDPEKHDFNRQAHFQLEQVRHQDPLLRRFLGKAIVKREGPYPPAVHPPTHYGPPPTTTTETPTEAPPTSVPKEPPTTTPVVPQLPLDGDGLVPEVEPVPCVPETWAENPACVFTELTPAVEGPVEVEVPQSQLCTTFEDPDPSDPSPSYILVVDLPETPGTNGEWQLTPAVPDNTPVQLPEVPSVVLPSLPQLPEVPLLPVTLPETTNPSTCAGCTVANLLPGVPELPLVPLSPPDDTNLVPDTPVPCAECTQPSPELPELVLPPSPPETSNPTAGYTYEVPAQPLALPEPTETVLPEEPSQPLPEVPELPPSPSGTTNPVPDPGTGGYTYEAPSQPLALPEPGKPVAPRKPVPNCLNEQFLKKHAGKHPWFFAEIPAPRQEEGHEELVDLRHADEEKKDLNVLSTQSQVILVQGSDPKPVLKPKADRQIKLVSRGSIRFRQGTNRVLQISNDQLDKQTNEEQVEEAMAPEEQPEEQVEFVLCTVDCYAVEDKVQAPETQAMEIPNDGRLW